ncbi:MAG: GGDEF domain-containing protein [Clostridiales bacterium]|nr:GGDEF domain-containing protein [Clostridiales bacterium]
MCVIAYVQMNIFGIIILYFFWRNQRQAGVTSLDDKLFNGILIAVIVEEVMDGGQWLLERAQFPGSYLLQVLCYSLGHAIAPAITCLWAMYCDVRTHMDERGLARRVPLYIVPIALNTLLLVVNLFTPLVFHIDEAHVYHRDRYFFVYSLCMYLYALVSLLMVIRRAMQRDSSPERTEYRYMALFIIPPLLAGLLQWMYYGLSVIWTSVVLSIIMVYVNVLSRQISTDPLTGLNNRRKLNRFLDTKIRSAEADETMFLMVLDADGFKTINDTYGHAAGDRALVVIADILKDLCADQNCFLARLGGDEFVILGMDREDFSPDQMINRLDGAVAAFNAHTTEPFRLSLSIGWARFDPARMNHADALLIAADQDMYRVKTGKLVRATVTAGISLSAHGRTGEPEQED